MSNEPAACLECGKTRTDEPDYNPIALITGRPPGWYSGDDGEICGDCMAAMFKRQGR